jgi:hypothetical protein
LSGGISARFIGRQQVSPEFARMVRVRAHSSQRGLALSTGVPQDRGETR